MPKKKEPVQELITISEYCLRKNVDFSTVSRKVTSSVFTAYTSGSSLRLLDWLETKDFVFRKYSKKYDETEWQDIKKAVANQVGKTMREKSNAHHGKKKYARY